MKLAPHPQGHSSLTARMKQGGVAERQANSARIVAAEITNGIVAAEITDGALSFVYGASLRVFLISDGGAVSKVSGDVKENSFLRSHWLLTGD